MAATQPILANLRHPAPALPRPASATLGLRCLCAVIAVACFALGLTVTAAYPIKPFLAMGLFLAWIAFATCRFSYALPAAVALIPVVGFASWTGWFTFEETDLLILASAAGGYAALGIQGPRSLVSGEEPFLPRLSIFAIALIVLMFAVSIAALAHGIASAGGLTLDPFNWSAGYDSAQNSLRIFKPLCFAILMTPLLVGEMRTPGGFTRFSVGMTTALGLGAAVVLRERLGFTGLLNFAEEYRVTGSFWEMHVGGAALDGFLALTIPFALREAIRKTSRAGSAAATVVLALAAYACLATFSRGVYAAIPPLLLTLAILVYRQRGRAGRWTILPILLKAIAFAAIVIGSGMLVFRGGGFRATFACLVVIALAIPVDRALRQGGPLGWLVAVIAAVGCSAFGILVAEVMPQGPYIVFALAAFACSAAVVWMGKARLRLSASAVIALWLMTAACAAQVAQFWGGPEAFHDSALVMTGLIVLVFGVSRLPRSVWPEQTREQLVTVGAAALMLGTITVFAGNAYMSERFATSRPDLDERLAHWSNSVGRLHGPVDWLFGKGLGRFPGTSVYESLDGTSPGSYSVVRRGGETFLALTGPHIRYIGFNEMFRVSQRIRLEPETPYTVTIEGRSDRPLGLHVEVCEKQLLYMFDCREADWTFSPDKSGGWQRSVFKFQSGTLGSSSWWASRPVFFALASDAIEIRSVQLTGPDGVDVIANGRFAEGTTRWFSSSDRFHLPWHIKNIALGVLFDQGAIGLALFTLFVAAALVRTSIGRARLHPDAPFVAAALVGYLVVGVFDTLLDVPRVAFLFYLVGLTGLMLRSPPVGVSNAGDRASRPGAFG